MAKKKLPETHKNAKDTGAAATKQGNTAFSTFLLGPKAKWVFFALYFLITVFMFREFLFSDVMLFGHDTIPDGIYTRKYYQEYHAEYSGIPRWNPYILGGLPFIDAMHGDTFYPGAWLKFFMPLSRALGHKLVWHIFLAGVFMYIFLRTLNIRRDASFLGGLMYLLAPSFVTLVHPAHDAKMYIIALLPLAFALLERGMNRPRFVTFVGLGGVMGFLILTSHAQMAYYSYWAIGLYFIFRLFTAGEKKISGTAKRTVLFAGAVALAVTLGAVQLLPAYKFTTKQSVRAGEERTGYEYATSWSMHLEETAGMIVPSFSGYIDAHQDGPGGNLYWGRNFFKLNTEYHGFLPIIFALTALFMSRNRLKWYFSGIAILSLVYALGADTPVYRLFYAFVPGVKNFRAPSMIIFLFCFAVVAMAAQFLSSLLEGDTDLKSGDNRPLYAIAVIAAAAVLVSIMGQSFFDIWRSIIYRADLFQRSDVMTANIPFFLRDMWRTTILAGASLAGIWMFLSKKIGAFALVILIALVAFIDCSVVNNRFIKVIDPATYPGTAPDRAVRTLQDKMKENGPFRIFITRSVKRSPNYYAQFGIQASNGFHNNELQSYELFRGGSLSKNMTKHWLETGNIEGIVKNNFLKVAGVRYIVAGNWNGGTQLIENKAALARAFIVHRYAVVKSDTAAVKLLGDSSFDPSETVIIEDYNGIQFSAVSDSSLVSTVESLKYTKDGAVVECDFSAPGFLVLTDNLVPYWFAFVDGESVPIHRAYGTFMAVACPEGRHEISFVYRSAPYETGKKMTLASLLFIVVSFAGAGISKVVKKKLSATGSQHKE